jgi:ribosomal protein L20
MFLAGKSSSSSVRKQRERKCNWTVRNKWVDFINFAHSNYGLCQSVLIWTCKKPNLDIHRSP